MEVDLEWLMKLGWLFWVDRDRVLRSEMPQALSSNQSLRSKPKIKAQSPKPEAQSSSPSPMPKAQSSSPKSKPRLEVQLDFKAA